MCHLISTNTSKGPSEREHHLLHAKVKALQQTLGISYKDAAHRLFMAEVEQVKKANSAKQSFTTIQQSLQSLVACDILPPIDAIDKGELDNYTWKDGKWEERSEQSKG